MVARQEILTHCSPAYVRTINRDSNPPSGVHSVLTKSGAQPVIAETAYDESVFEMLSKLSDKAPNTPFDDDDDL